MKRYTSTAIIRISCWLVLLFTVSISFVACHSEKHTPEVLEFDRYLKISLTTAVDSPFSVFTNDALGGNFTEDLTYLGVKDVSINIEGTPTKLEDALENGSVSEEDIFYFARLDAKNGICQEICESTHGLTNFTYRYPEFDLRIIYDIYETPDGQQHLISDLGIYAPGTAPDAYRSFIDQESMLFYDSEDWGLVFKTTSVSPTSITLNCTQSGGQQIGELYTAYYAIRNSDGWIKRIDGENSGPGHEYPIVMGGSTELALDWNGYFGELPSGNYTLDLYIEDKYDDSQVHPLMVNYHDRQAYVIEFVVP